MSPIYCHERFSGSDHHQAAEGGPPAANRPRAADNSAQKAQKFPPPFRTETADGLEDRPACRAIPTGLVPGSMRRMVEGLAAIRIRCASRGDCCRRDIAKDAAILAHRNGYHRSRRGAETDNNLSVPVNGKPAPNELEEPGGRDEVEAFEVSPADTETGYSAP
jgi:hypothetical protein